MGPETGRSAADRLASRTPDVGDDERAAALAEANRAIAAAESLAREYQGGRRSQKNVVAELRRLFPWLDGGDNKLADKLGQHGYYLVIM